MLARYQRPVDEERALAIARSLVVGKLHNQMAFWQRRGERERAGALRRARDTASDATDLPSLRGLEGSSALAHFRALAELFAPEWRFDGLRSRPARDPINALLNFGYSMLYGSMLSAVQIVGLDPYIGYLHQPKHGHAALASDLMEEFRAPVIDSLVVLLVNRREFAPSDFRTLPEGGTRFREEALPRFLARFEERMETRTYCTRARARFTYRQMLERQARMLARVLREEEALYRPYHWDY